MGGHEEEHIINRFRSVVKNNLLFLVSKDELADYKPLNFLPPSPLPATSYDCLYCSVQ